MSKPGGAGGVLVLLGCIILLLQWVLARAFSAAVDSSGSSCGVEPRVAPGVARRSTGGSKYAGDRGGGRPTANGKEKKKEFKLDKRITLDKLRRRNNEFRRVVELPQSPALLTPYSVPYMYVM